MLSDAELLARLRDLEADHVERTRAVRDNRKIGEAICAFANDLPGRQLAGTLFIGVADDGSCAALDITDELLTRLADFARNGTINPLPMMHVRKVVLDGCAVAVVEVQPSENPPVKYEGRVCVRRGPQRGYSTPEEDRRLVEKRRWGALPFDQQPVAGASIADLDLLRFRLEYLPAVVAADVLAENGRETTEQLLALRLTSRDGRPTVAGMLFLGKDPRAWLPGAYVQFVRYPGDAIGDVIRDEKEIGGPLAEQFRFLDEIIAANIEQRGNLAGQVQETRPSYPVVAIQEIVRNALIHRAYEGTTAPVRLTWYADRVEITSPGAPYGQVTAANFGRPGVTDYRNPTLASAAKEMSFAQRFGSGLPRAQAALARNGNAPAEFSIDGQFVHVTVRALP